MFCWIYFIKPPFIFKKLISRGSKIDKSNLLILHLITNFSQIVLKVSNIFPYKPLKGICFNLLFKTCLILTNGRILLKSILQFIRKCIILFQPISISLPPVSKGILLDYSQELNLENRFKAGFSITSTSDVSTSAMCFLCGSAGIENILICCICCEPYHTFCVENFRNPNSSENDWICMRCAPCQDCKGFDKNKISCPKCLKIYHNECFSSKIDANSPKVVS